jgi:cell division protein FtsQ
MKKRMRRAKRRLKILIFIVGLALILLVLLYAPLFNITAIDVVGATRYTPDEIRQASGILLGENGFRKLRLTIEALELRLIDSESLVESLPYIKDCRVNLVFPNKVVIQVTERQPAATIKHLDSFLIVDGDGYVLESNSQRTHHELAELRGIEFTKYTLGGQLEARDIELVKIGVNIIEAIKTSDRNTEFKLFDILDWIDMVDRNNVLLSLDNRIIVRFNPEDKLQYTIDFTKEIFFKKISSTDTGRLEFSGNQNPSFIPQ